MPSKGILQVKAYKAESYIPLENTKITIIQNNQTSNRQIEQIVNTDSTGTTPEIEIFTPPLENSMKPTDKMPYGLCDIKIEGEGFRDIIVNGCQVYPDNTAIQVCNLEPIRTRQAEAKIIDIQPNTLVGNFPPKIPESEEKPLPKPPTGFVVLPKPVVPEFIVVHAGRPDSAAPNYTVRYKDYIKNVASSEIFSTWPESTIRANVYCIISFTLNRIYTEWYRGKGKNFDITNSTAFDHAFTYGRNIFQNISRIVDDIFSTYVKRVGRKQPLLTQYCDGVRVQCPGWLTQWGSKYLGDAGKFPYEILTDFYGTDIELTTAEKVSGIPKSYPGYPLRVGSTGQAVRTIQMYLNRIAQDYPAISKLAVDGIYGESTKDSVSTFQKVFNLAPDGIVGYDTWYKISDIYVGVTRIAELRYGGERQLKEKIFTPPIMYNLSPEFIPTIKYFDDEE